MWNPPPYQGPGTKLRDLKIRRGNWQFSEVLRDLLVAQEWGFKDPEEFWELPPWKRALMIATIETKYEMSTFEDQQARSNRPPTDPKLKDRT